VFGATLSRFCLRAGTIGVVILRRMAHATAARPRARAAQSPTIIHGGLWVVDVISVSAGAEAAGSGGAGSEAAGSDDAGSDGAGAVPPADAAVAASTTKTRTPCQTPFDPREVIFIAAFGNNGIAFKKLNILGFII
jgi:hypothetical protein